MALPQITLDVPSLKLILTIVGSLLLIAMIRIVFLLRTNSRLRESADKMEKQVLTQHNEILAVRQDSNAWRGEIQRMFDAFRAEFSKRLSESEERYQEAQRRAGAISQAATPALAPPPVSPITLVKTPPSASKPPPAPEEEAVDPLPALSFT